MGMPGTESGRQATSSDLIMMAFRVCMCILLVSVRSAAPLVYLDLARRHRVLGVDWCSLGSRDLDNLCAMGELPADDRKIAPVPSFPVHL